MNKVCPLADIVKRNIKRLTSHRPQFIFPEEDMKRIIFALRLTVLVFGAAILAQAQTEQIFALPELERPRQIVVERGRVYFVDRRDIGVYYLSDGLFLKRIGKLGQGPGEFAMGPKRLAVLGDRLIVMDLRSSERIRTNCTSAEKAGRI
jgi:hypothetical protein